MRCIAVIVLVLLSLGAVAGVHGAAGGALVSVRGITEKWRVTLDTYVFGLAWSGSHIVAVSRASMAGAEGAIYVVNGFGVITQTVDYIPVSVPIAFGGDVFIVVKPTGIAATKLLRLTLGGYDIYDMTSAVGGYAHMWSNATHLFITAPETTIDGTVYKLFVWNGSLSYMFDLYEYLPFFVVMNDTTFEVGAKSDGEAEWVLTYDGGYHDYGVMNISIFSDKSYVEYYTEVPAAKLYGNGTADIFIMHEQPGDRELRIYRWNITDLVLVSLLNVSEYIPVDGDNFPRTLGIRVIDIDYNGEDEVILVAYAYNGSWYTHVIVANGTSAVWKHWSFSGLAQRRGCTLGDLDGDGTMDIIVATDKSLYIVRNLTQIYTFTDYASYSFYDSDVGYGYYVPAPVVADIDGDSKTEIVTVLCDGKTVAALQLSWAGSIGETQLSRDGTYDPRCLDSDSDSLNDYSEEYIYSTNAYKSDTDGDGLTDGYEVLTTGTDPNDPDTDNDGFSDGYEIANGMDPLTPDSLGGGNAENGDTGGGAVGGESGVSTGVVVVLVAVIGGTMFLSMQQKKRGGRRRGRRGR